MKSLLSVLLSDNLRDLAAIHGGAIPYPQLVDRMAAICLAVEAPGFDVRPFIEACKPSTILPAPLPRVSCSICGDHSTVQQPHAHQFTLARTGLIR